MKNLISLSIILVLSSCSVEEVPRIPILASPLGLKVKTIITPGGVTSIGLSFSANNPESYFSGFAVFVSTREEDFKQLSPESRLFPIRPTDVSGNMSQILTNYNGSINNDNVSIWLGSAMSFPSLQYYPPPPTELQLVPNTPEADPEFSFSSFNALPDGTPFVSGTTYYFAVYSYSAIESTYSLPSNIAQITYP